MPSVLKRGRASRGAGDTEIWHLNCGTMGSLPGDLFARVKVLDGSTYVVHCLLIEAGGELVLVDTGYGVKDCTDRGRVSRPFRAAIGPVLDPDETAFRRIWGLDLDPRDVGHIVMTHLDRDHAGGLADFPWAKVHALAPELEAARSRFQLRPRYARKHFAHDPDWVEHEAGEDEWFGFAAVRPIPDLGVEIAIVSLPGHSAGHAGVAVRRGERWLLHCGDAFFFHGEIEDSPHCPPGLTAWQAIFADDRGERNRTLERLRGLKRDHGDEVDLICSHDPLMMVGV